MAVKIKSNKNLLDFIPVKNEQYAWETTEEGLVQINIPRNGFTDKLVRRFKKVPAVYHVDLDAFGSCTWQLIDGNRDVHEIGNLLKEKFGEEIEPVYVRTGQFMNLLKNNRMISFREK